MIILYFLLYFFILNSKIIRLKFFILQNIKLNTKVIYLKK